MEPEYKVLDILFAKEVKSSTLKVGDDIVYMGETGSFDGKIITHRIINIEKEEDEIIFYTKGIANYIEDPKVYSKQIYGKIVHRGIILSFMNKIINNPIGFFTLIVIPVAVLIFLEIIDRINEKEKKEEEILDIDE